MADLLNSSDMMTLEGLPEELLKKTLRPHCYRVTEQGVIMVKISVINELRMYDLPNHSKSIASAISGLLNFVDELINKKKSVDPIPVIQKSAIEKPANNPCKDLPDVLGCLKSKLSNQNPLARAQRLNLVLQRSGGQQNKGKDAGCIATGLIGSKTGLTCSSRVL